ncbi:MAG TPA: hypothetical protein VG246_09685 [Acidimicrobiales bacterium]|nr:hypothetical protein [Acidimicrobiales bacterium]
MATLVVLVIAVVLLAVVLRYSSRHGDRRRGAGTSLRRGPQSHTTSRGQPKKAYATRQEAAARAATLSKRDGVAMGVYKCGTCSKWHVGHER